MKDADGDQDHRRICVGHAAVERRGGEDAAGGCLGRRQRQRRAVRANSAGIQRLERTDASLEETVAKRLEKLEGAGARPICAEQFRKMDEHMVALRNTESVNQRLFDSLHEELISIATIFCTNRCRSHSFAISLILFDDLSGLSSQLKRRRTEAKASAASLGNGAIIWKTRFIL